MTRIGDQTSPRRVAADGRLIAYYSTADGGGDIWTMRPDGSGKRNDFSRHAETGPVELWAVDPEAEEDARSLDAGVEPVFAFSWAAW